MDQKGWDKREAQLAAQVCVTTHVNIFHSTVGSDGMTKTADVSCHLCAKIAAARVAKEQKAQCVEITGPAEVARHLALLGSEDTLPGVPPDEGSDSRISTIPDIETGSSAPPGGLG